MSDERMVTFGSGHLMSMIASLTKAVTSLSGAVHQLAIGDNEGAEASAAQAGQEVDDIISVIEARLKEATDER